MAIAQPQERVLAENSWAAALITTQGQGTFPHSKASTIPSKQAHHRLILSQDDDANFSENTDKTSNMNTNGGENTYKNIDT